jgi:hypothetical protein
MWLGICKPSSWPTYDVGGAGAYGQIYLHHIRDLFKLYSPAMDKASGADNHVTSKEHPRT